MAHRCLSPRRRMGYRRFSFLRFLIFGWLFGPLGTFVFWPTLISMNSTLHKIGIGFNPWAVTQWCWGFYWVTQNPDKQEDSSE